MAKRKNNKKTAAKLPEKPPFASRGAVICMHRNARDLSLKQFAHLTGISERTLGDAERGDSDKSDDTLAAIALALDLDFELLKHDPRSHPRPRDPRTIAETKTLIPFVQLSSSSDRHRFAESLSTIIGALSEIYQCYAREGSTIVGLDMTFGDIHRLAIAFQGERLAPLSIVSVNVLTQYDADRAPGPDGSEFLSDIFFPERKRAPTRPKED